jgi:preprotein translocase subunit YajC
MTFFIAEALADNAAPAAGGAAAGGTAQLLAGPLPMIVLFIFVFYFFIIRPQNKRAKDHKTMLDALSKGDEVVAGGVLGRVTGLSEGYATIEVSDGVEVKVQRQAIQTVLPKGTIKSA